MKNPKDQIAADPQSSIRLTLLTRPHVVGSSSMQICPTCSRGATQYVITKLKLMNPPARVNVQNLFLDIVTNHGATDSREATVAPIPSNTSNEGRAQQTNVLNEPNSEI